MSSLKAHCGKPDNIMVCSAFVWISIHTDVRLHSPSSLGLAMDYRGLQVGWATAAELIVTHANIIDQNTVLLCSLETQPTCKPFVLV